MPMQRSAVVFYVLVVAVMSFAVGHCVGFARAERDVSVPIVGEAEKGFFIEPLFPRDLEEPATEEAPTNVGVASEISAGPGIIEDRAPKEYEAHMQQAILRMMESRKPEVESVVAPAQKSTALDEELINHFKELAARAITPYGSVIAETVMVRIIIGADSWTDPCAAVIFQTEDGHWWKVNAERNEGGSWCYDSPLREDSPLTYDGHLDLARVPPRAN